MCIGTRIHDGKIVDVGDDEVIGTYELYWDSSEEEEQVCAKSSTLAHLHVELTLITCVGVAECSERRSPVLAEP